MADERIGLQLEVEGQQEAAALANQLAELEKRLQTLRAKYSGAEIGANLYAEATAHVIEEMRILNGATESVVVSTAQLENHLKRATGTSQSFATQTKDVSAATGKSTFDMGRFGMAVNAAAQGMEDMQYGVAGAMNNLSQVAMLMGAGGLVIAGVTMTGVAINQLVKHWGDLEKAFGQSKGFKPVLDQTAQLTRDLKKLDEEIEALEKKDSWGSIDQEKHGKLKADRKAMAEEQAQRKVVEEVESVPSAADQEAAKAFKATTDKLSGARVADAVREAFEKTADGGKVMSRLSGKMMTPEDAAREATSMAARGSAPAMKVLADVTGKAFGETNEVHRTLVDESGREDREQDRKTRRMIAHGEYEAEVNQAKAEQQRLNKSLAAWNEELEQVNKEPIFKRDSGLKELERKLSDAKEMLGDMADMPDDIAREIEETLKAFADKLGDARQKIREGNLISISKGQADVSPMAMQADYQQAEFQQQQRNQKLAKAIFNYQMASADTGGAAGTMQRQMLARFGYGVGMNMRGSAMSVMQRQMMRRFGPRPMNDKQAEAFWQMQKAAQEWQEGVDQFKQVMESVRIVL